MLGPIPQLASSFVAEQLDGGTGSEQPQPTRPQVPEEQLRKFRTWKENVQFARVVRTESKMFIYCNLRQNEEHNHAHFSLGRTPGCGRTREVSPNRRSTLVFTIQAPKLANYALYERQSMINVIDVEAVIDEVTLSVPVIDTV